jgi:hypothetical protein
MKRPLIIAVLFALAACAGAYYLWAINRVPDIRVDMSDRKGECNVSKGEVVAGTAILCSEIPEYLLAKMEVRIGTELALAAAANVSWADLNELRAALEEKGYRIGIVVRVAGFINDEPTNR